MGNRPPEDRVAVTVHNGTKEADAVRAFLRKNRPPSIRDQFVTGWPHKVPTFWVREGLEILENRDDR